ncbi:MAG: hypothetical protein NTZ26_14025 [Candidatus Aminicenantes bacterium]|nr:hypothetical protein [Candidatus Aminicenantes bacterium]
MVPSGRTDSGSVSLLTSIVLALGITRILTGIGKIVQLRGRIRHSWLHLLWALDVLLFLLLNWWVLFRWHTTTKPPSGFYS